jgi:hypothetical protein
LALDPAQSLQLLPKSCVFRLREGIVSNTSKRAYETHSTGLLLGESRKRPRCCGTKNALNEISPSHSRPASLKAIVSGELNRLKG